MDSVIKLLDEMIVRYPVLNICKDEIEMAYRMMVDMFTSKGKLLIAGNGGSAADSEHIVGELMKGFTKKRELPPEDKEALKGIDKELSIILCNNLQQALPAISLTGHLALSTAYSNDVNGTLGFAQQVYGYGEEKDVFLGITTSGNSKNILYAMAVAKSKKMKTIALTGGNGGKVIELCDISIIVPESETYKIQELHLPVYHTLCLMLEERFYK